MIDTESEQFIEKLAKSSTGRQLINYLKKVEIHFADIRNVPLEKIPIRKDALEMLRECLLDKLLVLSGEVVPPNGKEWT